MREQRKSWKNIAIVAGIGLAAGWTAACAQPSSPRRDPARAPATPAVTSAELAPRAAPGNAAPPLGLSRQPIALPRPEALSFELRPMPGGRGAVAVSDEPAADEGRGVAHLRLLHSQGQLGPVRSLRARRLVAAFDEPRPLLLTSDGASLCVEPASGGAPACELGTADFAVPLAGKIALLRQRPVEKEEAEEGEPDEGGRPSAEPPEPERVRLWLEQMDEHGKAAGDPVDTELELVLPLMTMGVIAAAAEGDGVRLLWYDQTKPRRQGRRWIPRARLYTGRLGPDGKLVSQSRKLVHEGDRAFGYIEGHEGPRLLSDGRRSAYLGRRIEPRGARRVATWEMTRLSPWGAVAVEPTVVTLDPLRLVRSEPLDGAELAFYGKLGELGPAPAPYLAPDQPARVTWTGERGWFVAGAALFRVTRGDPTAEPLAAPFEAQRSRLWWSTLEADGAGLAYTSDGLVELGQDGSTRTTMALDDPGLREPIAPAARIGDSWWVLRRAPAKGSGGALTRLLPSPLEVPALGAHAQPGASAVIGGVDGGLFLALAGTRLGVWRLGADGALQELAVYAAPFGPDLVAAPRAGGGALLASHARGAAQRIVVAAIDERGQLSAAHPSRLAIPLGELRLVALPGGGALLFDRGGRHVGWHDEEGRELSTASWPAEDGGAACLDGAPMRRLLPSPEPGMLVRHDALATPDSCVDGLVRVFADGSVRWFGSAVSGIHSRAEVGLYTPAAAAAAPALPTSSPAASAAAGAAAPASSPGPCPADMVLVAGRTCIDRFEARLVDAASGLLLSPDYPSTPNLTRIVLQRWTEGRWRAGDLHAQAVPLPLLGRDPGATPRMLARGAPGLVPSGYVTGLVAGQACAEAGKRLCSREEWRTACRGEEDRDFPYGDSYQQGVCNVFRYAHPAASLHRSAAVGHLDPRLNRVTEAGKPLLQRTGSSPRCASRWGDDAVYDMVGNLDEWLDDEGGAFAGGFYSRSTRKGCDALITAHPRRYLDYSLGVRCCLSASR